MKQQPSFGMKMNNQYTLQKDKVSFGAPFVTSFEEALFATGSKKMIELIAQSNNVEHIEIPAEWEDRIERAERDYPKEIERCQKIVNVIADSVVVPSQCFGEAEKAVKEMKGHGFKGVVKGVSKAVGAPVSAITTTIHEVKKDLKDRPSSPREKKHA